MADGRSGIRWLRVVLAGFLAELTTIIVITLVIVAHNLAVGGAESDAEKQQLAARAGFYVAPVASIVLTFLFALWVARKAAARAVLHGTLVGVVAVVLSAAFIFAAEPAARWMYAASYVLKLLSGYAGGAFAGKRRAAD